MRIGPEQLIYLFVVITLTYGIPIFGIIDARKRRLSNTASTISIIAAGLWVLMTVPSFALGLSVTKAVPALLSGYWFYLANQVNRGTGSSMHLF